MIWVDTNCPKHLRGYIRNKYLGKPYNVLTNGKGGFRKASEIGINPKLDILSE